MTPTSMRINLFAAALVVASSAVLVAGGCSDVRRSAEATLTEGRRQHACESFVARSQNHTPAVDRQFREQEPTMYTSAKKLEMAETIRAIARGELVAAPIARQVLGMIGALPAASAQVLDVRDAESAVVEFDYAFTTEYPERQAATRARGLITNWPTSGMADGFARLPAVVECVAVKPPTYRAVTADELKPYLKGKKIIGLEPPPK